MAIAHALMIAPRVIVHHLGTSTEGDLQDFCLFAVL
jgi:hypothetical protein